MASACATPAPLRLATVCVNDCSVGSIDGTSVGATVGGVAVLGDSRVKVAARLTAVGGTEVAVGATLSVASSVVANRGEFNRSFAASGSGAATVGMVAS